MFHERISDQIVSSRHSGMQPRETSCSVAIRRATFAKPGRLDGRRCRDAVSRDEPIRGKCEIDHEDGHKGRHCE